MKKSKKKTDLKSPSSLFGKEKDVKKLVAAVASTSAGRREDTRERAVFVKAIEQCNNDRQRAAV